MIWLTIFKLGLQFINWVAQIVHDKQLLQAGEAKAHAEGSQIALEAIRKAQAARKLASAWPTPELLRDDPNNTDN